MDKTDFIKRKDFCSMSDIMRKLNRKWIEQEKIFAMTKINKGIIPRIYKECL